MALFNSFQFGDVDSKDYGVYISGDSVYDSPARSVDLVQVPGRNGALALDNGYYENIEVTYPAGSFGTSQEEWREKMLGIRNALAAQRGYQRLIDTYHPEHYRLGMFFAGISASPVQYNRAGQFPIRFNCKPQRFLISGDEAVEFTAEGQEEVYGPSSIASFEAEEGTEIRELTVNLEPIQSGTGDPSPTNIRSISGHTEVNVYRTGKNLADIPDGTKTTQGLTLTATDGTVVVNGTATATNYVTIGTAHLKAGVAYTLTGCASGGGSGKWMLNIRNAATLTNLLSVTASGNYTPTEDMDIVVAIRYWHAATLSNLAFEPMLRVATDTDDTYEPYAGTNYLADWGINQWDETWEVGAYNGSNGSKVTTNDCIRSADFIPCLPKTQYYATKGLQVYYYRADKSYISYQNSSVPYLFTTPADAYYMTFNALANTGTTYNHDISINYPSTITDYHAYADPHVGMVYGGKVNVITGLLTVNMANIDLGTLAWTKRSASKFSASLPQAANVAINVEGHLCSCMPIMYVVGYAATDDGYFAFYKSSSTIATTTIYVNLETEGITSVDALNEWFASHNAQLVYELAEPITYQLTPSAVSALLGQNNIWADSGEVEVKVASPVDLTNPTNFPAKPLIRIYGNGSVQVGDTIATVQNNADGYVDIDCESMNCYDTTGGRNADVSFSGNDFPELASGDNGILLTGPSKVEITPRWWEL